MKSIKSKIFIFALLATLIPSLILGLLSFHQNESSIRENLTRELRTLANHAGSELVSWINQSIHEANSLTTSKIMIGALSDAANLQSEKKTQSPDTLASYLRLLHAKLDTFLELTVIDTQQEIIASSSDQSFLNKSLLNNLIALDSPQQSFILPPFRNEQFGTVTVSIALPILSYENYILGQLVLTYDLQSIKPKLEDPIKSSRGGILILDTDGRLLLDSHRTIDHTVQLSPSIYQSLVNNPGELFNFQDFSNKQIIGLAQTVRILPVTIIAGREYEEVYAARIAQRNFFLILVCASIFIVAAIAIYLGRSIVTPLQRLINATDQIVKGSLDIPLTTITQKDELGKLAQMFNHMTEKLRQSQAEILTANEELKLKNQLLEKLCVTDSLTGLYNRSKLNHIINDELSRSHRNKRPFAILMIDIDYFKELNDTLGHIAGDEILAAVSRILTQSIRSIDFAARYGGDEFIIVLTETTAKEATFTAERIRAQVSEVFCSVINQSISVTLSIGIAQSELKDTSPTDLITRADNALYQAKKGGRNQARVVGSDI
ncbi:MAG: diguanylate cyclase [Nitrosomonas sp.]|nr:diguanylate cyclase [Nitrosomonas sp.]MCW5608520.1 diguanylate cyclase [Nitrosomonas sp.]